MFELLYRVFTGLSGGLERVVYLDFGGDAYNATAIPAPRRGPLDLEWGLRYIGDRAAGRGPGKIALFIRPRARDDAWAARVVVRSLHGAEGWRDRFEVSLHDGESTANRTWIHGQREPYASLAAEIGGMLPSPPEAVVYLVGVPRMGPTPNADLAMLVGWWGLALWVLMMEMLFLAILATAGFGIGALIVLVALPAGWPALLLAPIAILLGWSSAPLLLLTVEAAGHKLGRRFRRAASVELDEVSEARPQPAVQPPTWVVAVGVGALALAAAGVALLPAVIVVALALMLIG